jgi:exosortase/archaeosortase family protein
LINIKKHKKKGLNFLAYFAGSFIFIYLLLTETFIYKYINYFFGVTSNFIINLISIPTAFIFDDVYNLSIIVISSLDYPIFISQLCTGILEFSLIVCAIFATTEVVLKRRILWMALSIPLVIIFNLIRIVFTVYLIVFLSVSVADIFHEILFRLFLVIIVVGFYYIFLKRMIKHGYFKKTKQKTNRTRISRHFKKNTTKKVFRNKRTNKSKR